MFLEVLERAADAGIRVRRVAVAGGTGPLPPKADALVLDGAPANWIGHLRAEAESVAGPVDALLADDDAAVRALVESDGDGRVIGGLSIIAVKGEGTRPPLGAPLFDLGFVRLRGTPSAIRVYARSELLANPADAGVDGPASVTMTTLGTNGRFANQIFQYAYLRLYGLRSEAAIGVPAWEGEAVFGLQGPRPSGERLPEVRFYAFDDDDLCLWSMEDPPVGIDFWGYFQEIPAAWERHSAFLRRMLTLRNEWATALDTVAAGLRAEGRTLVSIHVRRGDYVGMDKARFPWYRLVPTRWYREWLDSIWPTLPSPVLHVATDDPGAVLPEFADYPQIGATALATLEQAGIPASLRDFGLLMRADCLGLINSSFSRAAALLATPGQRVYLPSFETQTFAAYDPWNDRAFWARFETPEACRGAMGSGPGPQLRRSIQVRQSLGWAQHESAGLKEETAALRSTLERERDAATAAQNDARRACEAADQARDAAQRERDEALARRDEAIAGRDDALAERDIARQEREKTEAALRAEIASILNSSSWRVTMPMRFTKRLLRGGVRKLRKLSGHVSRGDWPALRAAVRANLARFAPPRAASVPLLWSPPAQPKPSVPAICLPDSTNAVNAAVAHLTGRVTVIVPCYNYGEYVEDAVRSVLAQTYPHVDVIVVDDGSTDPRTREVLDAMNWPRVRVLRQRNQGLSAARNNGAALTDAAYLMFLDADDRLAPVAVATLLAELEAHPEHAFAYSYQRFFGDVDLVWAAQSYNAYDLLWSNHPSVCSLIRGDWYRRSPRYRSQMLFGYEDWEFWLALSGAGGYGLCVPVPVFEHRRHGVTMTQEAHDRQRYLTDRIRRMNPAAYAPAAIARRKAEWRPLVSVIIPFYNGHRFLAETLATLEAQTCRDFEVILANDGSEDPESQALLEELRQRPDLRVLDLPHRGLPATRNAGALAARSEYIFYLDSDDLLDPTALEKLTIAAALRPNHAFIYSGVVHFGEIEGLCIDPFDRERLTRENYLAFSCLIRRDIYIAVGGMDEALTDCYEDYDFWLRLIAAGHEGYLVPEPLFLYRRHGLGNRTKLTRAVSHEQMLERLHQRNPALYGGAPADRSGWKLIAPEDPLAGLTGPVRALAEAWRANAGVPYEQYRRNNTPLPFPPERWEDERTSVLYFVPHCVVGGAERVDLEILAGLPRDRFRVVLLVEHGGDQPWLDRYKAVAEELVVLPSLAEDEEKSLAVCLHYAMARAADILFVRNSRIGYRFVERLKDITATVQAVDLLHLHSPDGDWVRASVLQHDRLDRRFVITRELRDYAVETYALDEERFEIIYCGVESERALPPDVRLANRHAVREEFGIPGDSRVVGFVGRMDGQKDPLRWIETAAILAASDAGMHFLLAGDGDLMAAARTLADKRGLGSRVHFAGVRTDVDRLITGMDLLLVTSLFEGLPLVVMEALLQGVPVVSTNTGGTAECLDDTLGALVPVDAGPQAIADAVHDAFTRVVTDPALPERARSRIVTGFSTRRMQEQYVQALTELGAGLDRKKRLSDYEAWLMSKPLFG